MGNAGFGFGQQADAHVIKGVNNKIMNPIDSSFGIGGIFNIQCFDKNNNLKWQTTAKNGVVDVGLNSLLDVYFNGTDSVGGVTGAAWGWALGLVDATGFTAFAATDTHASHAGWSEFTSYTISGDATLRPQWSPGSASGQSLVNPTLIDYDITSAGTVHGLFIVGGRLFQASGGTSLLATDADNKGSTNSTPLLWATSAFTSGDQTVNNGDIVRVTYTISAQSA